MRPCGFMPPGRFCVLMGLLRVMLARSHSPVPLSAAFVSVTRQPPTETDLRPLHSWHEPDRDCTGRKSGKKPYFWKYPARPAESGKNFAKFFLRRNFRSENEIVYIVTATTENSYCHQPFHRQVYFQTTGCCTLRSFYPPDHTLKERSPYLWHGNPHP